MEICNVDLDAIPKQKEFFKAVMAQTALDVAEETQFYFGGAIRGGKTFAALFTLYAMAQKYKNSRWVVVRDSLPNLQATSIPSMEKILEGAGHAAKWNRSAGKYYVEFKNGSRIIFFAETFAKDPELNRFLGLECNGFLLEQIEELQLATLDKCVQRAGSWYCKPKTPPPFILATFNPTGGWLKDKVHDKWVAGTLPKHCRYFTALPSENPFVTPDQWNAWNNLDPVSFERFIKGDWTASDPTGLFFYSFRDEYHTAKNLTIDPALPVWLSFDFNVNPMTCLLCQINHQKDRIRIIREFREENSNIHQLLPSIQAALGDHQRQYRLQSINLMVTGDPAGRARSALSRDNLNHYQIIQNFFRLGNNQLKLLPVAPTHDNSYPFCNSIFCNFGDLLIDDTACKYLISDLKRVKYTDGSIKAPDKSLGHLLDCLRYFLHVQLPDFIRTRPVAK